MASTAKRRTKRKFRRDRPLPLWAALLLAAASGALLTTAFQPLGLWPLVLVATVGELWALRGQRLRWSFAIGLTAGLTFWFIHIAWITVYLGPVPLIALGLFMALWRGVGAVLITLTYARLEQWVSRRWQLLVVPVGVAAIMLARESASSAWPWGGFAWGRLSYTQAGTIVGDAVSWVSAAGLSFLLMLVSALLVQLVVRRRGEVRRSVTVAAAAVIGLVAIPAYPVQWDETVRVGAVQGASEAGLLAEYERGDIVREHYEASLELEGSYDVVVLPENAGEINPYDNARARMMLDSIAERTSAPVVVGAVTGDPEDFYNSALVWQAGQEPEQVYHKRHPVPFAEYLPARDFFKPILEALDFYDLIPRDYSIDPSSENAFTFDGFVAGVAICFDIKDDRLMREMVLEHGATVVFAPTNNADFGEGSSENVQQLAIAQLRAQELGRSVVNISTVGTSAMMLPNGQIVEQLPQYVPGTMSYDLPTSSTITPAVRLGGIIDWVIPLLGFSLLLVASLRTLQIGRRSA